MEKQLSNIDRQRLEFEMLLEMHKICKENNLDYYLAYGTVLGAVRHKGFIPWDNDIDIIIDIDSYEQFCDILENELSDKYCLSSINTDRNYDSLKARVSLKDEHHHIIHIDIFPMVGAPDNKIYKKLFSKISYINYRCFFVKKVNPNINYKNSTLKRRVAYLAKFLLVLIPPNFFLIIFKKMSKFYPISNADTLYNICGSYGDKEFIPKNWLGNPVYMEFEGHRFPVPQEWDKYLTHIYGDYMTPKKINYV